MQIFHTDCSLAIEFICLYDNKGLWILASSSFFTIFLKGRLENLNFIFYWNLHKTIIRLAFLRSSFFESEENSYSLFHMNSHEMDLF